MDEVKKNSRALKEKLVRYNQIRKAVFRSVSNIGLEDLLCNGKVGEIPPELLRDAAAGVGAGENCQARMRIHNLAKDILLLWARIYCIKVLFAKYRRRMNDDIREKILYGISLGTVKCFENIRDDVNRHFSSGADGAAQPFSSKGRTVRDYMLICAANKVKTELGSYYHEYLIEVSDEEAARREEEGEKVYCRNGRHYIGKFLPLEIPDEDEVPHSNAEVMEQITMDRRNCADEMLQSADVKRIMNEVIGQLFRDGILDRVELEFVSRCFGFRGEPEKLSDIERDWKKRGKKIESGNLYNFRRSILGKIQKAIRENPEWTELAYHTAA